MSEETGTSEGGTRKGPVRAAGVIIVLLAALILLVGPRLFMKFEEPPVVDVSDILRGEVTSDIVMVRGIVQREGKEQGYIFLGDVGDAEEIVVGGISMLPVIRVRSWSWFDVGQQVRLPVRITRDEAGNLLLVETRRRGEQDCRVGNVGDRPLGADSSAGRPAESGGLQETE